MDSHNHYADEILDRVSHLRKDEAWLKTQHDAEHTVVIPVWRSRNLIANPAAPRGVMLPAGLATGQTRESTTERDVGPPDGRRRDRDHSEETSSRCQF